MNLKTKKMEKNNRVSKTIKENVHLKSKEIQRLKYIQEDQSTKGGELQGGFWGVYFFSGVSDFWKAHG